jgi:Icc-related predicted phosphoesterase
MASQFQGLEKGAALPAGAHREGLCDERREAREASMKIQIFSDLHLDAAYCPVPALATGVDTVVVAGDVREGAERGFAWLRQIIPMQIPIISVLGNHEFYRRAWSGELARARAVAPLYGVRLLENNTISLGGVRFIGASLWTDYLLFGEHSLPLAMPAAAQGLNDHKRIMWSKQPWRRFRPQEALLLHRKSRAFIETALAEQFTGATVVVTHHAPSPGSLHPRYQNDLLSAAYVSDLTSVIEAGKPDLWVHGHVHASFDYRLGETCILCNPNGYGRENLDFDPVLIVTVGS